MTRSHLLCSVVSLLVAIPYPTSNHEGDDHVL